MSPFPPTVIWRHRRENLEKCSLRGLETREDFLFYTYPIDPLPCLENYFMLDFDAPLLSSADRDLGIFLIDGTWSYAGKMANQLSCFPIKRSLPTHFVTAYPRKQTNCPEPKRGLASIEALFVAYTLLERATEGLLDHFRWKDLFLERNRLTF